MSTAQELAYALVSASENGLHGAAYRPEELRTMLPHAAPSEVDHAAAELIADGYLERMAAYVRPTRDLYLRYGPQMRGTHVRNDAKALIRLILEGDGAISTRQLHAVSDFDLARFNWALIEILDNIIPNAVKSREISPDYETNFVSLRPEDRVRLERALAT